MTNPRPTDLAVGICTQDNQRTIAATIESVQDVATHTLVVDSGSTDGTIQTCQELGAEVLSEPWRGFAAQKQFLLDTLAEHRWILLLDSDEAVSPDLAESIRAAITADDPGYDGWELNRKLWFLGAWLHHTFQPEWRLRLVRGHRGKMTGIGAEDPLLHEAINVPGKVGRLDGDLKHDSWSDLGDMCTRYVRYGALAAESGADGGRLGNILISPAAAFAKQLLIKRGILDGRRGLIAAGGAAMGTLVKHLFLAERRLDAGDEE